MRIERTKDTIRVSKIVIEDGLKPHRIVLRRIPGGSRGTQYVTHLECLQFVLIQIDPLETEIVAEHEGFSDGRYFAGTAEGEAAAGLDFDTRAKGLATVAESGNKSP